MPVSRVVLAWVPVVAWAAVIFTFSSIPDLSTGLGTWDLVLRKLAHTTEYAILGMLLWRALGRELPAFAAGVAYACSDEIHQHFVRGRHASPVDVAIDAAGVLIGVLVVSRVRGGACGADLRSTGGARAPSEPTAPESKPTLVEFRRGTQRRR